MQPGQNTSQEAYMSVGTVLLILLALFGWIFGWLYTLRLECRLAEWQARRSKIEISDAGWLVRFFIYTFKNFLLWLPQLLVVRYWQKKGKVPRKL